MKIEIKNGVVYAIPETNNDLKILINSLRNQGEKSIISFGIKKEKKIYPVPRVNFLNYNNPEDMNLLNKALVILEEKRKSGISFAKLSQSVGFRSSNAVAEILKRRRMSKGAAEKIVRLFS